MDYYPCTTQKWDISSLILITNITLGISDACLLHIWRNVKRINVSVRHRNWLGSVQQLSKTDNLTTTPTSWNFSLKLWHFSCVYNQVQHRECLWRETVWKRAPLSHFVRLIASRLSTYRPHHQVCPVGNSCKHFSPFKMWSDATLQVYPPLKH